MYAPPNDLCRAYERANQRARLAARYYHAQDRAARAAEQGDRTGSVIAAGDARRIMAAIVAGRTER